MWDWSGLGDWSFDDGATDVEIVGIGVGRSVQAADVEGVAAAVGEAGDGGGVGRAARGGEGLGHGVVGHACTRAVATGGGFVRSEERRGGKRGRWERTAPLNH